MNIKHKEIDGLDVSLNLDRKNYGLFLKEIKNLGKKYEGLSNVNNLKYSVYVSGRKNPYMKVKGWCSRVVNDGKVSEVIFIDYDNILYRIVQDELKYLMEEYALSPFYVFKSKEAVDNNGEVYGNYMAVCLTKKTFKEVIDIQNGLHCDSAYKKIALIYRFKTWVLRLGPKGKKGKPVFKEIIGDPLTIYFQDVSNAHLEALHGLYPEIPKIVYPKRDSNDISKLFVTEYLTASP